MEKSITIIQGKAEAMQKMVDETSVTTVEELKAVADKIKNVKILGKAIRTEMEKTTKPAKAIIAEAQSKYLPYEKMCKEAEVALKGKAQVYMSEVERIRKEKEEKIANSVEKGNIKEQTGLKKMENLGEEKKSVSTDDSQIQMKRGIPEVIIVEIGRASCRERV